MTIIAVVNLPNTTAHAITLARRHVETIAAANGILTATYAYDRHGSPSDHEDSDAIWITINYENLGNRHDLRNT